MPNWLPVVNYEHLYLVSDTGLVKRIGGGQGARIGRILRFFINKKGYVTVTLTKNCVQTNHYVHRLVMAAFVGENESQVNHINGNKQENSVENLEYVTASENLCHATSVLKVRTNEKHWNAKLDRDDVSCIVALCALGFPQKKIASMFSIAQQTVSDICNKRRWMNL